MKEPDLGVVNFKSVNELQWVQNPVLYSKHTDY